MTNAMPNPAAPRPGEVAVRGARVASLLGEPPESRGDLVLVLGGGATVGLAVGVDGLGQLAGANMHAREVPPRPVGRVVLGQLGHLPLASARSSASTR